jgi:tetratricopeptide (TPR) repeat protein
MDIVLLALTNMSQVLRAKSFRESGRPDLALRDFALAVQLDPSQLTVYIGRSALYMSLHKHALALQDCMKALELDPKNVVAHRRSGLVFAETRRLPQAIRAFNRALALRADYESLTLRGRSYVQLGEFDKALNDYSLAISLNPDVALAYGHRSVLYAHLKRLDLAINDASSFINLSGGDQCLSAYQNRGVWWAQMGQYERAIEDFNHVIAVQPTNSFAYMSRGTAYAQMERFADSIVDWQKVAQLHPNMVKAYFNLGKQYANSGDHEHAAHYFAHVTRLMPNSVAGYQERAKALAACGKLAEALEVWQQALDHDKHNPALFEGCAETHLALQQLDEAVVALTGAIRLNPADPLNYERRAATYFKLGKPELGRSDIITAKKLRWTMEDEKRAYDKLIETGHAQERPHMQIVRAAKAASAATLAK